MSHISRKSLQGARSQGEGEGGAKRGQSSLTGDERERKLTGARQAAVISGAC